MFLQKYWNMAGFELNHHWHGIDFLIVLECALIATLVCAVLTIAPRLRRRFRMMALVGTLLSATAAYAANTTLGNLSASGALAGANLIYVVQTVGVGGVKATMTQVATFINSLFSGDATVASGGAITFATVNSNVGTFGSATSCITTTQNAKGLTTAISAATCTPAIGSVTGLATGIATWLGTPSSANLLAALTDKTGTGLNVFSTAPTISSLNATTAMTLAFLTGGGSQCLQVSNTGVVSGTGSACGAGGGGVSSIAGNTGAFTLNATSGITNSTNDIICSQGSSSQFGCVKVDGTTMQAAAGVLSSTPRSALRATTTTSEALANSDQNKLVTFTNASAIACTIAQAGSGGNFFSGWAVSLKNLGAGTVTCTATTSFIDTSGNFTVTLTTGQGVDLYSDGTNYFTQPGKGGGGGTPGGSSGQVQYNNAGAFGGYTPSGDCTVNTGTGVETCTGPHPGYISGSWYGPFNGFKFTAGSAAAANTIACRMQVFPRLITINSLGAGIGTPGSTNTQFALYANSASNRPSTLIGNTGNIANNVSSNTQISGAMAANKQVGPGGSDGGKYIWACVNQNDSTITYATTAGDSFEYAAFAGDTSLATLITGAANGAVSGIYCQTTNCQGGSSTFGTWPANLSTSTWSVVSGGTTGNYMPAVFFKAN